MINDLAVCDDISLIMEKKIILFGTGYWGQKVSETLNCIHKSVYKACNSQSTNGRFNNCDILSIDEVKRLYDRQDILIIITSTLYYQEMLATCEELNFELAHICTLYAFYFSLFLHKNSPCLPEHFCNNLHYNLEYSSRRIEYSNKMYLTDMLISAAESSQSTVWIYQPGKVGSQSIWNSIKDKSLQFHSLATPCSFPEISEKLVNFYLDKIKHRDKIKIITGVREPIARDLSAMFQNSETSMWPFSGMNGHMLWWYGDYINNKFIIDEKEFAAKNPTWEHSINHSFNKISNMIITKKVDEFSWFDYEIKAVFGIDIFQYPFDKEQGYGLIQKDNIDILVYKMEKLSELEDVIATFIEDPTYQLINTNIGEKKIYSYVYREFKKQIILDTDYFEYYYTKNIHKISHFYTEQEIEYFKNYWKKHIAI